MTLAIRDSQVASSSEKVHNPKTVAEFFAGIGLMRMALDRKGWTTVLANDIDEGKYRIYEGHFGDGDGTFLCEDIHKMAVQQVPSVTLATASFPCNDLSLAGGRQGLQGSQSSAFWGFTRILELMAERRPPIVLLENVPGFLTSRRGSDFEQALLTLNGLGYTVDSFILDAARFVPQSRQRLFVVGILEGTVGAKGQTEGPPFRSELRPQALAEFIHGHPNVKWRIRHLPAPPNRATQLQDILEDLPDDAEEWWSETRAKYLLDQMSPHHRQLAEQMINATEYSYGTVFRRMRAGKSMGELRADGIAGCLRTPRGGSGRQILFKAGKGRYQVRLITPREAARLMGAGDYKITVPLNQALFGFGDAVCVPVIEWIAEHYLNHVADEVVDWSPRMPRVQAPT
jgi:DNA (cytosine-5)-methyltransferase 1